MVCLEVVVSSQERERERDYIKHVRIKIIDFCFGRYGSQKVTFEVMFRTIE